MRFCDHFAHWHHFEQFFVGRHDRRQMPVGQGGFHIGALSTTRSDLVNIWHGLGVERFRGADFLYVYDCGSEPKRWVEREVKHLARNRTGGKLDMLFLSHFDRDHICGTPDLLRAYQVDTILIPFVDEAERMISFARAAGGESDDSSFFRDMAIDPVATLQEFSPRQIIQIVSDDGTLPLDSSPVDPPSGEPEGSLAWKLVAGDKDGRHRPTVVQAPDSGGAAGRSKVFVVQNPAAIITDRHGSFEWLLKPRVSPADPFAVAQFYSAAEKELNWVAGSFRARMKNCQDRRDVVTNGRTKLARAYRTAFSDKNLTSMCLYSGPYEPDLYDAMVVHPVAADHRKTKIGWMGTGDAHLKEDGEIDEFERFYRAEIKYVSSFVLPHHGSIKNSNPNRLVSDADHWIASAEPSHDWLHPDPSLVEATNSKGQMWHVRSKELSAFDELMLFVRTEGPRGEAPHKSHIHFGWLMKRIIKRTLGIYKGYRRRAMRVL